MIKKIIALILIVMTFIFAMTSCQNHDIFQHNLSTQITSIVSIKSTEVEPLITSLRCMEQTTQLQRVIITEFTTPITRTTSMVQKAQITREMKEDKTIKTLYYACDEDDAQMILSNITSYPVVQELKYSIVYDDASTSDFYGNPGCGQGATSDGDRYIYYANWHNSDDLPITLKKYDTKTNTIVLENRNKSYYHANGMAYCNADGKLYIAHADGDEWKISVVDSETLEFEREINILTLLVKELPEEQKNRLLELDEDEDDSNWSGLAAIGYDKLREKFLLLDRHNPDNIVIICDKNMNFEKMITIDVPAYPARQGIFSDDFFIYTIYWDDTHLKSYLYAWDWDGKFVWNIEFQGDLEIEGATIINDKLYFTFNTHEIPRHIQIFVAIPSNIYWIEK